MSVGNKIIEISTALKERLGPKDERHPFVVLGPPNSGKTSALCRTSALLAADYRRVCVIHGSETEAAVDNIFRKYEKAIIPPGLPRSFQPVFYRADDLCPGGVDWREVISDVTRGNYFDAIFFDNVSWVANAEKYSNIEQAIGLVRDYVLGNLKLSVLFTLDARKGSHRLELDCFDWKSRLSILGGAPRHKCNCPIPALMANGCGCGGS